MPKVKIITIIIVVAVAAGFGVYRYGGISKFQNIDSGANKQSSGLPTAPAGVSTADWAEYANENFGFSFRHPKEFATSEIEDENGVTVLLQKSGAREGFQIYISEFDEPGPITPERIREDLPDIVINQPQQVLIGEKKDINALIFLSKHESLGDVREAWFVWPQDPSVSGNYLYQLTAYADMDNFIGPVLETLKFQE